MDDLVAWLRTVLDEDARDSRHLLTMWKGCDEAVATSKRKAVAQLEWQLADIEAKRAIIDLHEGVHVCNERQGLARDYGYEDPDEQGVIVWCPTVSLLASAYADRPGYRAEWRP